MVNIMDRKLLFLVNPISGTRTKEKLIAFITEKVTSAGFLFTIDYTNATGNYTLLKEQNQLQEEIIVMLIVLLQLIGTLLLLGTSM